MSNPKIKLIGVQQNKPKGIKINVSDFPIDATVRNYSILRNKINSCSY